jgi:hypothetical protein
MPGDWIGQTAANAAMGQYITALAKLAGVLKLFGCIAVTARAILFVYRDNNLGHGSPRLLPLWRKSDQTERTQREQNHARGKCDEMRKSHNRETEVFKDALPPRISTLGLRQ